MTPILYEKDEIEFTSHGLGDLTEIYDVDIHEQRNGLLQLTASYPVTGIRYDDISVGRVILAKPNQRDDNHAFRIVRTELDISGYAITIEADSITYDLTHNLVKHLNVNSSDGQTFMNSLQNAIVNPSIFTFYSDVSTVSTTKLDYINPMEAIMGTTGSFLQIWGGELKRENRRVAMFNRRGRDNVSTFRLGKNIAGLKYTVDIGSLVTRIIPTKTIQSDDQATTLEGTPVDSKYINSYEQIYTLIVDFTDDKIKTVADLNATAKNWFTASTNTGVDLPNITVDIDVLSLQDSTDYQDKFKNLESVSLTDTVTVYVPEYGVNVTAIVNELHYDPIQERVTKLTVGTAKQSFADSSRIQLSDLQNKIVDVKNQADSAVVNANGKNTNYYGSVKPSFPQEGDLWYWINGDQSGIKQFVNGDWVSLVDSDTEVKIAASVDAAVAQAQSMDTALNQSINDSINETMTTVNNSLAVLDSEAAVFKSEADSATSSVASSVSALMTTTTASLAAYASSATSSANKALSSAAGASSSAATALSQAGVNSLATSSVASDVNGLKASYTSLNSSAGVLTSQTASLAVSASSASAQFDKVTSTTGSLATETAALKVSASSASAEFTKVNSSAGSLATQAASLAVSASSAAIGISNVTSSAGSLATRTASLAVSASSFSTSITSMASQNGSQATAISALTQRADGFDMTVAKVDGIEDGIGGRNWLLNTASPRTIAGSNAANYTNTVSYFNLPTGVTTGSLYTSWGLNSKFVLSFDWTITGATIGGQFMPQFNGTPWYAGFGLYTTVSSTNNKGHIVIYGTVTSAWSGTTAIRLSLREDNLQGSLTISNMKMEQGTVPTAWSPAPEDIDAQFATQKITIDGITSTVSKQTSDINAVTTRVQTAEGSISTAQNNITGLQSSQTQTANQLQTEITDRNTGDANTLTQAKSFTTSQIATYDTGIQSQFTQTSDSFIATLSAINQVVDSSLTNGLDMWRLVDRNGNPSPSRFYATTNVPYQGVASIGYSQTTLSGDYTSISTQVMTKNGWQASTINVSVDVQARTIGTSDSDYLIIYLSEWDSSGTYLTTTSITGTISTSNGNWVNYRKKITLNTNTMKTTLTYQMRGNGNVYISRPYVGVNELPAGAYVEGPVVNNTATLALMANNYTFGLNSNGQLVSGIMGNEKQVTLAGNTIHLDGKTIVSGDFYALGGNFKNLNASEIKTGTINASLINVINLNASNITTGKLNALLLTGNTGYLGTVNTGRVVNSQDNHLQLASYGFYDTTNDRAQVELLNNDSAISAEMRGSFNYYGNPTDKGNGLGIRMKYNQILAIDESGGSKNLYLSPYAGGQVRIVSRDLNSYYDIAAANFRVSSQRKFKSDIKPLEDGALDIVNKTNIKSYVKNGVSEIGVIADEAPDEVLSDDGKFINIYDYTSVLYKAVQELSAQVKELQNERPNNAS